MKKQKLLKILAAALALSAVLFCFAACKDEQVPAETKNTKAQENTAGGVAFYVTVGQTRIELGADAAPVISALGEPQSRQEIGDCAGLGAQVRYNYPSVILYTLISGNQETVDQITLRDDTVSTPAGIRIGSTEAAVLSAYGEPAVRDDSSVQYISGNLTLKFRLSEQKVSGIDLIRKS